MKCDSQSQVLLLPRKPKYMWKIIKTKPSQFIKESFTLKKLNNNVSYNKVKINSWLFLEN